MDVTDQRVANENAFICTSLPCNIATANTAISKHGLFVSGIIHNLAPSATIHLVRVLDDYGVGDLVTLTNALSTIENSPEDPHNVIVNLSLSIEPPSDCLIPVWQNGVALYMRSSSDPTLNMSQCRTATLAGATGGELYQKRLILPLGLVIQNMISEGFTVVAAAGNDSKGTNTHYGADFPAAFCGVYAAAASSSTASGDWQSSTAAMPLSDFSNDPYAVGSNGATQCLYVPTGSTSASLTQIGYESATPANNLVAPGEGVCSLYLHVGDTRDPNDANTPDPNHPTIMLSDEWTATWSGSSFATAMVSGNLAAGAPNPTAPAWKFLEPCA